MDVGRAKVKLAEILKLATDTGKRSDAAFTVRMSLLYLGEFRMAFFSISSQIISRRSEAAYQWLSKHVEEEPDAFIECVVVRAQLAQILEG